MNFNFNFAPTTSLNSSPSNPFHSINKIENLQASTDEKITYSYPAMVKTLDTFRLEVQPG